VRFENDLGMRFVLIPAGTFQMGEPDRYVTRVTLTQPYYLQITEVTNAQFRRYRYRYDSGTFREHDLNGDDQPVVGVAYEDATGFAAWLSRQDPERAYRLPTEAQWEYACRAGAAESLHPDESGSSRARGNGLDVKTAEELGLSSALGPDDGYRVTAPVGSFPPNPWGVYDMMGNAAELCPWCTSPFEPEVAVDPGEETWSQMVALRGGSWRSNWYCNLSFPVHRAELSSRFNDQDVGFRLVTMLPDAGEPLLNHNEKVLAYMQQVEVYLAFSYAKEEARPGEVGWPAIRTWMEAREGEGREARLIDLETEAAAWLWERVVPYTRTSAFLPKEPYDEERIAGLLRDFVRLYDETAVADRLRGDSQEEPWPTFRRILREHPLTEPEATQWLAETKAEAEEWAEGPYFGKAVKVYERLTRRLELLTDTEVRETCRVQVDDEILRLTRRAEDAVGRVVYENLRQVNSGHLADLRRELRRLHWDCGIPLVEREIEQRLAGLR